MSIKTLSTANVNIGSKPDFPNGLTVSSGNVGIGTRTASYPLDVQTLGSGVTTAQRLLVNSSSFTFANGSVTVNTVNKTGTITITSAEAYTSSFIYTGMIVTATNGTGNLGTMAAGTYVTVTGTSVNGSSQLVIAYSYPGGTDPGAGTVTSVIVSGYVAGWGPSLLFTGGGAPVDLASISGLVGTSNSNTAGDLAFNTRSSGTLAERMRITSTGNVGIGTSSPEDVLHVKGTGQWVQSIIDSTPSTTGGSTIILRGNQNSWALSSRSSANGTTNNGFSIYETLATNIRFVIQTGGNVGIGTSSPGQLLQVAASASNAGVIRITSNAQTANGLDIGHGYVSGTDNIAWILNRANADFVLGTNNAANIRITSTGNVGIGTSSPGAKLEVNGNIRFTGETGNALQFGTSGGPYRRVTTETNASGGTDLTFTNSQGSNSNGAFVFKAQDTSAVFMTIRNDGNVGIGTTSPAQVLHVAGRTLIGGATTNAIWDINADSMGINRNISSGAIYDATGHAYQWQHTKSTTAASNTLSLQVYTPAGVGVTGGMTITGAGNVGIATSSPAERLHVNGNVLLDNQNGYYVKNTAGTSCRIGAVDSANQLIFGDTNSTSMYLNAGVNLYFSAAGTNRGNINGTNGYWRIGDSNAASVPLDVLVYSTQSTNVLRLTALAKDYTFANGTFSAVSTGAKTIVLTIDSAETTTAAQITASCIGSAIYGTGASFGSFTAFSALFTVTSATTISNKLVITCTWTGSPTTTPSNGAVTAIIINGYRAGWGPQLLFAGMGDGRDTGAIRVLTETDGGGANAYMAFCTRGSETVPERMRLTSTGRLGIGTTDPSAALHVVGTVAGGVAPRCFIPAGAFTSSTATLGSEATSGQFQYTFAAGNTAYVYLVVPANYGGGACSFTIHGTTTNNLTATYGATSAAATAFTSGTTTLTASTAYYFKLTCAASQTATLTGMSIVFGG